MAERHLTDLIEDFTDERVLQSAQHRLLVIEKNITNFEKDKEIYLRENEASKERVKICQNRINFIKADIRSVETLKYNIEAKIAEFIETIESPDSLPVMYDPQLELFIDQKIEYYSNHVVRHRDLSKKKAKINANIKRLQKILDDQKKELANHFKMVAKYNNWISELRNKQIETSTDINKIEGDIVQFLEESNSVTQDISHLIGERFEFLQNILENKMRTLMQLNEFSHHIQSERIKHVNAISSLNEKIECLEAEINSNKVLLEENNLELHSAEMKYSKVEQQIFSYIDIQEKFNIVHKCRAYYDLLSTYGTEKENAQDILNSCQETYLNDMVQLSSIDSNINKLLEEKRQMEIQISTLTNASK